MHFQLNQVITLSLTQSVENNVMIYHIKKISYVSN